ncbi:MAG: hypothetical protein AB1705_11060 [Verrucomicrobiota bacterium]
MNQLSKFAIAMVCLAIVVLSARAAAKPEGRDAEVARPDITKPAEAAKGINGAYGAIVIRNAFGLRPPDPPKVEAPPPPVAPAANIKIQGIVDYKSQKKAMFALQQPGGKQEYVTLQEGERAGSLEVLEINLLAGEVKVKNAGVTSLISFKTHGVTNRVVAQAPPRPGQPPGAPGAIPIPQPTTGAVQPPSNVRGAPTSPSVTTFNNPAATGAFPGGTVTPSTTTTTGDSKLRTIPSRTIRVAPGTPQASVGPSAPDIDPVKQAALMELNRQTQPADFPPLPPIPE